MRSKVSDKSATKSPDSRPDSREDLIDAGKKIFAELGFDRATVKDIADRARVNVSAISYYFGGKESLYNACLEGFGNAGLAFAERILKAPLSCEDFKLRLKMFTEEFILLHLRETDICKIIHRDFEARNPIALEVFQKSFIPLHDRFVDFLAAAKKARFLRDDLDPAMTGYLLFGQLVHIIRTDPMRLEILGKTLRNPKDFEETIHHLIKNCLEGIEKKETS